MTVYAMTSLVRRSRIGSDLSFLTQIPRLAGYAIIIRLSLRVSHLASVVEICASALFVLPPGVYGTPSGVIQLMYLELFVPRIHEPVFLFAGYVYPYLILSLPLTSSLCNYTTFLITVIMSSTRPIVFMDINIGETPAGRIKMELFSDVVPKFAPATCGCVLF
jgi:hypothetical protein